MDAVRFEHLVERARREAERGIADGAAKSALELWRGAPLADVAEEPFAAPEIRRLEELHLRAIELTIDAELAAGRHGEVIGTPRGAARRASAPRALSRPANARPLPRRAPVRGARGLPRGPPDADRGDRNRARGRAAPLQEQILAQDPALDAPAPPEELPRQLEGGSPLLAGRERELRLAAGALGGGRGRSVPGRARLGPRGHRQDPARGRARGRGSTARGRRCSTPGSGLRGCAGRDPRRGRERAPDAARPRRRRRCAARCARGGGGAHDARARGAAAPPRPPPRRAGSTGARRARAGGVAAPGPRARSRPTRPPRSPSSTRPPKASRSRSSG